MGERIVVALDVGLEMSDAWDSKKTSIGSRFYVVLDALKAWLAHKHELSAGENAAQMHPEMMPTRARLRENTLDCFIFTVTQKNARVSAGRDSFAVARRPRSL